MSERSDSTERHWQQVYASQAAEEVGWYQAAHEVSIDLIRRSGVVEDGRILDVGSGATTLLDGLLEAGYSGLIAVDISTSGLQMSKQRLGEKVQWLVADITKPSELFDIGPVDLWHDRAVLHFFTSKEEREGYLLTLRTLLKGGGHAVIETFSPDGAPKCSGLELRRYDEEMLQRFLGEEFVLLESRRHVHSTPSGGQRPYVSTLFRRLS